MTEAEKAFEKWWETVKRTTSHYGNRHTAEAAWHARGAVDAEIAEKLGLFATGEDVRDAIRKADEGGSDGNN